MACPLFAGAVLWRRRGGVRGPYGLCVLGLIVALALLIMTIGADDFVNDGDAFFLVGAGGIGLVLFAMGSIVTGRRSRVKPMLGS